MVTNVGHIMINRNPPIVFCAPCAPANNPHEFLNIGIPTQFNIRTIKQQIRAPAHMLYSIARYVAVALINGND